jgi:hypothetical protein
MSIRPFTLTRLSALTTRAATPALKLIEIKRPRADSHPITLLNDGQFWRLAVRR